ncbi:hypothetical protein, partial [Corynebacterium stationis]|uniref:hypothetical protein n=1 Tax=Corynebacterium stationis TaxID=1705 RepID=UPI00263BE496
YFSPPPFVVVGGFSCAPSSNEHFLGVGLRVLGGTLRLPLHIMPIVAIPVDYCARFAKCDQPYNCHELITEVLVTYPS